MEEVEFNFDELTPTDEFTPADELIKGTEVMVVTVAVEVVSPKDEVELETVDPAMKEELCASASEVNAMIKSVENMFEAMLCQKRNNVSALIKIQTGVLQNILV